ncbi:MAG TPA: carbohydrate porin [Myxococcales bacterium]|nr:carbohydrate porin [Myxococcales bacterium]
MTTIRTRAAAAFLVLLASATTAGADEATTPAPASTRALAPPFRLVLPHAHLLGDWLGTRTWLEDHGITPTVSFVTDALGNPSGGKQHGFTATNNLGVDLLFDLHKIVGLSGSSFEFAFSERFGSSLTQEYIGNVFSVQQIFPGTYRLVTMAYRQELFDDAVEIRLGRIASGDDFLVSPYSCVFVQNGFCGNPVGIFFNSPGMTAYPAATWGAVVKVKPTRRTYAMGGVYNGDPSIRDNSHHGADFSLNGPVFVIGEIGYQRNGLPGDDGLIGNYKAGFWYDDSQYTDFTTVGPGQTSASSRGNWGIYGQFDQVLVRFGGPGSVRGFGITGSILASPDDSVSQLPIFANAALVLRGLLAARATDVLGFGVVYGHFSNDLQDSQRREQQLDPTIGIQEHELALELTYRLLFLEGALFVQPDAQYVIRPGGTGQIDDAFVAGLQAGINF